MVLNKQQKEFLKQLYEQDVFCVEDMTPEQQKRYQNMNDHELIWQDGNRYLADLFFNDQRAQSPF